MPTPDQARTLKQIEHQVAGLQKETPQAAAKVKYNSAVDAKLTEEAAASDFVWIDDGLPAGAKEVIGGGVNVPWKFVVKPAPVYSGAKAVKLSANNLQQLVLEGANPGLRVGAGDKLFAYVYLDAAKPPKEIMLQWHSSGWLHRAYWGENVIPWGADNSSQRLPMGKLPPTGQWVRLEVEASKVGIQPNMVITGWAFTQHGGTAYWDRGGLFTRLPQGERAYDTLSAWVRAQKAAGGHDLPHPTPDIVNLDRAKRTDMQKKQLLSYFLENAYSGTKALVAPVQQKLAALKREKDALEKQMPTTL